MAKDQSAAASDTQSTLAETLRSRRSDPDFHAKLRAEGPHAPEREKLRLKASHIQPALPRAVADLPQRELAIEDPSQARTQLREMHERMLASVLGGEGLIGVARLAAGACGAPVVIVVPDIITIAFPIGLVDEATVADLELRADAQIHGLPAVDSDEVRIELPLRIAEETVGLVALLRTDADLEPMSPWILDVAAAATLTSVAIERARLDAEHRLRGSFLEQLRSGAEMSAAQIARRARRLGCELADGAVLMCVEVEGTRPLMVASVVVSEYPGAFAEPIDLGVGDQDGAAHVWAVLPAVVSPDSVAETEAAAERLAARLRQYGSVGISRFHADPAEFRRAMDEAELMLDVMRRAILPSGDEIVGGTYKLLFRLLASHPDELSHYHESTIAPLAQHDEQYRTDLIRTLEAYLDTNCNMNVTAETIFAHRHTVAHRLERINELTGLDASIHEDRERLGLGLKIHRLMVA